MVKTTERDQLMTVSLRRSQPQGTETCRLTRNLIISFMPKPPLYMGLAPISSLSRLTINNVLALA